MKYYEWELDYIIKKIKECDKRKLRAKSDFKIMQIEREMQALETIYFIVKGEQEHLEKTFKR